MSIAYEQAGRTHQKKRTREALVAAARELVAQGESPPSSVLLLRHRSRAPQPIVIFRTSKRCSWRLTLRSTCNRCFLRVRPKVRQRRLDVVIRAFVQLILDTERPQRTMLRLSLEQDPTHHGELPLRKGRAIGWMRKRSRPSAHGWLSPNCGGSSTP